MSCRRTDCVGGLGPGFGLNPHIQSSSFETRTKEFSKGLFPFSIRVLYQKRVQLWGSIFCCGDHFIGEMTKGHRTTKTPRSRVSEIKKGMPFKCGDVESETTSRYPRSWKQKQRSWMMNGLRKIGAPVVTCYIEFNTTL